MTRDIKSPNLNMIIRIPETIYSYIRDIKSPNLNKNSFYGSIGYLLIYANLGGNYERLLVSKPETDVLFKYVLFRIGGGGYSGWACDGSFWVSTISGLTGSKNEHLELSLGIAYLTDDYGSILPNLWGIMPAGGIGYRFQKPNGSFIFRTGIASPEALYVSFGFSF